MNNVDKKIIEKCQYLLSSFQKEPDIVNNNAISFKWKSKPEELGYLKYSVCLDILDINQYNLKVKYYDEVVCDYQGNDNHIDHYVYLVNKFIELELIEGMI